MKFIRFLLIAGILTGTACAEIIERKQFAALQEFVVHPDTLVILDLDNTVFEPEGYAGSDQWFSALIGLLHTKYNLDHKKAFETGLKMYIKKQFEIELKPVEKSTPLVIDKLQQSNRVIAVTLRSVPLVERTLQQLCKMGIDLSKRALEPAQLCLPQNVAYCQGCLFTSGQDKGPLVQSLLQQAGIKPPMIVMIDDKKHYLESVEKACTEMNIPFIGIHYTHLHEKVHSYIDSRIEKLS